jgi:hypothetical protein
MAVSLEKVALVKALSLKQPWAELILLGKKTIETRTWNTSHRGRFLIHAAAHPDLKKMQECGFAELPVGCIVGEAEIAGVKEYADLASWNADAEKHRAPLTEWTKKRYGYVLENVKRLPLKRCKGKLNFFEVEW